MSDVTPEWSADFEMAWRICLKKLIEGYDKGMALDEMTSELMELYPDGSFPSVHLPMVSRIAVEVGEEVTSPLGLLVATLILGHAAGVPMAEMVDFMQDEEVLDELNPY